MLEAIVERVGIPRQKVYVNVEDYGNIASASLPIALDESRQTGMIRPGESRAAGGLRIGVRLGLSASLRA